MKMLMRIRACLSILFFCATNYDTAHTDSSVEIIYSIYILISPHSRRSKVPSWNSPLPYSLAHSLRPLVFPSSIKLPSLFSGSRLPFIKAPSSPFLDLSRTSSWRDSFFNLSNPGLNSLLLFFPSRIFFTTASRSRVVRSSFPTSTHFHPEMSFVLCGGVSFSSDHHCR